VTEVTCSWSRVPCFAVAFVLIVIGVHLADLSYAGNTYSIRNVGSGTARVFFAQTREKTAGDEE
jgi:hypothetical protein